MISASSTARKVLDCPELCPFFCDVKLFENFVPNFLSDELPLNIKKHQFCKIHLKPRFYIFAHIWVSENFKKIVEIEELFLIHETFICFLMSRFQHGRNLRLREYISLIRWKFCVFHITKVGCIFYGLHFQSHNLKAESYKERSKMWLVWIFHLIIICDLCYFIRAENSAENISWKVQESS